MEPPARASPATARALQRGLLLLATVSLVLAPLVVAALHAETRRALGVAWAPFAVYALLGIGTALAADRGFRAEAMGAAALLAVLGFLYFFWMPWIAAPLVLVFVASALPLRRAPASPG